MKWLIAAALMMLALPADADSLCSAADRALIEAYTQTAAAAGDSAKTAQSDALRAAIARCACMRC